MDNYFNYFTEIEDHFIRRRGSGLLLSTLDWALIETWKNAGIPLAATLRGIDAAFDRYDQRASKTKKVNSLAYCAQEVLVAAEDMKEAAVGTSFDSPGEDAQGLSAKAPTPQAFELSTITEFLRRNSDLLTAAQLPEAAGVSVRAAASEAAGTLRKLADELSAAHHTSRLEHLERRLTVLEDKLFAALLAATKDEEIVAVRAEADRDLAPYRRKMPGSQIEQLHKQYVSKRLLDKYNLPRLSLFYM